MRLTRRQMLQAATASVGLVSMPAVVTRAFAAESLPLRGGIFPLRNSAALSIAALAA